MKFFEKLSARIAEYDEKNNFTCDVCGREVFGGERICLKCASLLPWNNGAVCPFCGRKVREEGGCLECKEKPLRTEKARSVFTHEGEAAALVLRFKSGKKYLFRTLCDLLLPVYEREFAEADGFVFVPMTDKALKKRGYNQSRLLAEELARRTGKPFLDVSVKTRESAPQKTLGRREREKNLEGCFRVTDRAAVKGKTLLLADDTLTTGATSSELADRLLRAGAKKVFLLTVTSAEKKEPFGIPPKKE
ncbi:MAG: ComF family protein [Candidatus Gallimonas sp.]